MKKFFIGTLVALYAFIVPGVYAQTATATASTSSFTIAPAQMIVRTGQTFTLAVAYNPNGIQTYTAKLDLRYPAHLLEVTSFTYGNGLQPLSQADYDSINNTTGVMVKTAGFLGGTASSSVFGTVTFRAKANGLAPISVGQGSVAYDANNQNILGGFGTKSTIVVSGTQATTTAGTTNTSTGTGGSGAGVTSGSQTGTGAQTGTVGVTTNGGGVGGPDEGIGEGFALNPDNTSQTAAVANWWNSNVGKGLLGGIIVLILIIGLVYYFGRRTI